MKYPHSFTTLTFCLALGLSACGSDKTSPTGADSNLERELAQGASQDESLPGTVGTDHAVDVDADIAVEAGTGDAIDGSGSIDGNVSIDGNSGTAVHSGSDIAVDVDPDRNPDPADTPSIEPGDVGTIAVGEPHPDVPKDDRDSPEEIPTLYAAVDRASLDRLVAVVPGPEHQDGLAATNLETHWVLAVMRGAMPTAGYGIDIEDIRMVDRILEIEVSLTDPDRDAMLAAVITHPLAFAVLDRSVFGEPESVRLTVFTADGNVLQLHTGSASWGGSGYNGGVTETPAEPAEDGDLPSSGMRVGEADIRGTVTALESVATDGGRLAVIRVEGERYDDTTYEKAVISIDENTRIARVLGNDALADESVASLEPGVRVQVLFTGVVMESYPVQAAASQVLILQ